MPRFIHKRYFFKSSFTLNTVTTAAITQSKFPDPSLRGHAAPDHLPILISFHSLFPPCASVIMNFFELLHCISFIIKSKVPLLLLFPMFALHSLPLSYPLTHP